MPARDDKGDARSGEVLDFQSYMQRKMSRKGRVLREISSSSYILLIQFTSRAALIWYEETPDVRRFEMEHLDIRDRSGRAIPLESGRISLLDLDRDFVTFRVAGLAAREDLQRRGVAEMDADATAIFDDIEERFSCIADWDAFVEAVRAYCRQRLARE